MDYLTPIHQEILGLLRQKEVAIIVNTHKICAGDAIDGYAMTWRDRDNDLKKTVLVMCNQTIRKNYNDWKGEINRTLSHEAVHIAQMCKEGNGYVEPLGFKDTVEKEAVALQDNPREVLRILKKYCF